MRICYKIVYKPGKDVPAADALWRSHLADDKDEDEEFEFQVDYIISSFPLSDQQFNEIVTVQQCVHKCKILMNYVSDSWPTKDKLNWN